MYGVGRNLIRKVIRKNKLKTLLRRVLVIGIGNEDCGDDGVGNYVCQIFRKKNIPGVKVVLARGNGFSLMEEWNGFDHVIAIDAVSSGAEPGHIFQLDVTHTPLPTRFFRCSTHDMGLAEAVEMARALGKLPVRFTVYGIEGARFDVGDGLSKAAKEAGTRVANKLVQEIRGNSLARRKIQHA
ncbi:MAG: hypothetical protein KCHDKBKB_00360 [Elusimicrobia bacterium]|nr:hypothetical protein [Elusimicrobiota bacterium]